MGTGKQRISTAVQLGGRVVRVELALVLVQPELELALVAAEEELSQVLAEPEAAPVVALELVIGPAAVPELETVPVVALELETVLVAVERELDQVAVVLVRDHLRARLALPVKTKSVTTAHRRGLVPLLAAEDLAAVAETTREPAAAEAVIAWAAAE